MIRVATTTPILAILVLMAGGGLASRVVLGFISPGAYAEEVLGARAFLSGRGLYEADARQELGEWIAEAATPVDPWTLPGITPCQGSALSDRARYYTSQGHLPTMLLASVPIVTAAGGQGLYVVIVASSCAALVLAAALLRRAAAVPANSRVALLILIALAGWQPVLASVRQGEALVVVAVLSAAAWSVTRIGTLASGVSGGVAAMMTLPALTVVPALLGSRFKAGLLACAVVAGGTAIAVAVGGATILQDFVDLLLPSASTYAQAANNYAVIGRALAAGQVFVTMALVGAAIVSLWRGRSSDMSFGAWLALGLLAAPIVWSQHLTLALVPLVVLLRRVLLGTSALSLLAWSLLAAVISAPDPLVAQIAALLAGISPSSTTLPVVSVALILQWIWIVAGRDAVAARTV